MPNWYATREVVKRSGPVITGVSADRTIDRLIEGVSRDLDRVTRRTYIPRTETRLYRWPPPGMGRSYVLWLDADLLALTTLQTKAQDSSPTTIASSDYFLEPNAPGPDQQARYNRIEIDLSSTAAFEPGDTPQRSISVAGSWGYANATRSTGTVSSGLSSDATATEFVCSAASLIGVGDTLLIQSEQVFVSERAFAALGSVLVNDASITAALNDDTITLDGSHGVLADEVIRLDSEQIYIVSVSGNDVVVVRAYNGTTLASHANDTAVHINRTLTIERGVNGTTGATHANATAISKYAPPFDIVSYVVAEVLGQYAQEQASWGRQVGAGDGAREFSGRGLGERRKVIIQHYQRPRLAAV